MIIVRGCEFPDDRYYHVGHNVWLQADSGGIVTLGATSFGVALAAKFFAFMPKPVGSEIAAGRATGMLELGKAIISLRTPVGGVIVAANAAAAEQPALINTDPYGAGWLVKLRVANWEAAKSTLVTGDAIAPAFEEAMRLDNFDWNQN